MEIFFVFRRGIERLLSGSLRFSHIKLLLLAWKMAILILSKPQKGDIATDCYDLILLGIMV